ncbi:MAG: hypothetical protein GVY08_09605 [Bacteroidetes bacterium]|jgi:hypothetical protein|nr:hypothetical protein [Bacteroidota bacterium]
MRKLLFLFAISLFLFSGCGSTESTVDSDKSADTNTNGNAGTENQFGDQEMLLARTRSSLGQHYSESTEMIPELFLREFEVEERTTDPYAGFRVQLFSTTNVSDADSVRDHFVAWADTSIAGYEPDAYVIFRSPNYRVRAGDFQDRDRAIQFSSMLKSRYPDAWVVHEQIDPSKVPADTSDIRFKKLEPVGPDSVNQQ